MYQSALLLLSMGVECVVWFCVTWMGIWGVSVGVEEGVRNERGGVEREGVGASSCQSFVMMSGFHYWNVFDCSREDESR